MHHNRTVANGILSPDALVDIFQGINLLFMRHKKLQNLKLRIGQRNHFPLSGNRAALRIQSQIRKGNFLCHYRCFCTAASPQNRLHAHQQLHIGKRLYDIIICPDRKAHHLIRFCRIRRQKNNRRIKVLANFRRRRESRYLRHIHIQNI